MCDPDETLPPADETPVDPVPPITDPELTPDLGGGGGPIEPG